MIEYSLSQRMDSSLKPEIHQKPHQKQNASLVLILSLSFISLRFIYLFFFQKSEISSLLFSCYFMYLKIFSPVTKIDFHFHQYMMCFTQVVSCILYCSLSFSHPTCKPGSRFLPDTRSVSDLWHLKLRNKFLFLSQPVYIFCCC